MTPASALVIAVLALGVAVHGWVRLAERRAARWTQETHLPMEGEQ